MCMNRQVRYMFDTLVLYRTAMNPSGCPISLGADMEGEPLQESVVQSVYFSMKSPRQRLETALLYWFFISEHQ